MNARLAVLVAAVAILSTACRDGVAPFEKEQPAIGDDALVRLTWNPDNDRDPAWTHGSDSLYYGTVSFFDFPKHPRTMLKLARGAVTAHLAVPSAQFDESAFIVLPAIGQPVFSPDGERLAYVEYTCSPCTDCVERPSCRIFSLTHATIRVRERKAAGLAYNDRGVGFAPVASGALDEPPFHPTWSPDGQRVAFSTGNAIHVWTVSEDSSVAVPNTAGGLTPSWSPDGSVIAFSQNGTIRLVTLAGNVTTLTSGTEPAWSHDGATMYYVTSKHINRIARAGGVPVTIPRTENGGAPAPSPDGNWLAFTRPDLPLSIKTDIWLLDLRSTE